MYKDFPEALTEKDEERLRSIFSEFLAGFTMMVDKGPMVTVFGSSKVAPGTELYEMGRALGAELAANGYTVLTGGGPGLMEAVNRGAHEKNGKSMGINIDIPDEQDVNPYANPSITINHFFVRKVLLLKYSSAYIFMPGGFGTLDELFETVTLMQTKKVEPFPLVLMKRDHWKGLIDWLKEKLRAEGYIDDGDLDFMEFADTVEEAMCIINRGRVGNDT